MKKLFKRERLIDWFSAAKKTRNGNQQLGLTNVDTVDGFKNSIGTWEQDLLEVGLKREKRMRFWRY